jgi:outer membrane immunogenic protein
MFRKSLLSTAALAVLGGSAFAADLPSRSAPPVYMPPPPPPIFSWTGVYIGGQIGYEWGQSSGAIFPTGTGPASGASLGTNNPSGVTGGAHIGYNYQINHFVVGVEGDVNGSNYHGNTTFGGLGSTSTRTDIDGSIRGRVGYAWDRALFYATGGAAFAPVSNSFTSAAGFSDTTSPTRIGWTIGGGVEYAITNNWSLRAEYRYTDYGHSTNVLTNSTGGALAIRTHDTDNRVQAGFSYKFDTPAPMAPPMLAKY